MYTDYLPVRTVNICVPGTPPGGRRATVPNACGGGAPDDAPGYECAVWQRRSAGALAGSVPVACRPPRVPRGTLSRRDAAGILPKHRLKVRTRGQGGAPTISGGEMAAPYQCIRITALPPVWGYTQGGTATTAPRSPLRRRHPWAWPGIFFSARHGMQLDSRNKVRIA